MFEKSQRLRLFEISRFDNVSRTSDEFVKQKDREYFSNLDYLASNLELLHISFR